MHTLLFCFLLFVSYGLGLSASTHCFFHPPQGWEMTDPTTLSPRVQAAFFKPRKEGFLPSINLATEATTVSLSEYLKAVKAIHEQNHHNFWRPLGKVHTAAGPAQLTQIDTSSEWGAIRLLQLILIKDSVAYILTAAALKEEFSSLYQDIQSAFRSFTLSSDLIQAVVSIEKKESLRQKKEELSVIFSQSKDICAEMLAKHPLWIAFTKSVEEQASEMGSYWQLLVLKQTQEELLNTIPPPLFQEESNTRYLPSPSETPS